MKSQSLHNRTKKKFMIHFYHVVTVFHEIPFTYPPSMPDVVIEQPRSSRVGQWLIPGEVLGGKIPRRFQPFYILRE